MPRDKEKAEPSEKVEFSVRLSIRLSYHSVAFLTALRTAIFMSTNDPEFAETLYAYLSGHPELIKMVERFPQEVSLDELVDKVAKLAAEVAADEFLRTWIETPPRDIPGVDEIRLFDRCELN